jgi:phosphopantetheinyl transferase
MQLLYKRLEGQDGHTAGRELLRELYGKPLPEIAYTKLGKPYFVGSDLHFSISHTPNHAFCVLSDRPVGIDAEEKDRQIRLDLAEKILSPSELEQFSKADDPRLALLKFWVLKEALGKCTGEGMQLWPNRTSFSPDDPRIQEIDGCIVAIIEQQ